MARSRSRMRPKSVARIFAPHPGPREPVPPYRDDLPLLRMQTLGASRLQLGYSRHGVSAGLLFPLVLRLVYAPGHSVERETLLRELWPRHEGERRRGNLRQALYKLRTMGLQVTLDGELVQLDSAQVLPMFCVDRTIPLFERDIIRGSEPFGPFVPGLVAPSEEMAEWLERTRASVHADVRRVLVEQLRSRRERADWTGAEVLSRWLLPFDPLNEDATLTLAECAMLNGSKAEAVAILDRYLTELGPNAGEIRLPATQLRKRFTDPGARRRPSLAMTERHFVGREQELSELTMAMRRARWHDGSAILLHGPPGIGKTRLLTELSKVAQIEGYREIALDCRESDQRRPLGVFLDAIPELLECPGALGCSPESLAVLRGLLGERQQVLADLDLEDATVHDSAVGEVPREYLIPPERARARSIRHALADLIGAIADERPVFLAVEDIHWIDPESWECLADLAQRTSGMRVFVFATSRSRHALHSRPSRFPTTIVVRELHCLDDDSSLLLARKISEDCAAHLSPTNEEWFVAAGEGSPLMIRSLVHHWVATGDAGGVPPTLQALLEQRVGRLHEHGLRTMQVIALLGSLATPERIRLVLELPTHELLNALEQLSLDGCLKQTDDAYFVAHELIGRAALGKLPRLLRATLHSTLADMLLAEHASSPSIEILLNAVEHLAEAKRCDECHLLLTLHAEELIGLGWPSRILRAVETVRRHSRIPFEESATLRLKSRLELELGEYKQSLLSSPGGVSLPADVSVLCDHELDSLLSAIDSASRADFLADRNELADCAGKIAILETAGRHIRLRALEITLVLAANTCNRQIAEQCYASCLPLLNETAGSISLERSSLLFHTVFGKLEIAREIATRYLQKVESLELTTAAVQDIGRAAFALRICGEFDACKKAFLLAFESARALDAPRLGEYPAWQLAQVAIDEANLDALNHWNAELQELLGEESDPLASGFATGHFCRTAILMDKYADAKGGLDRVRASLPRIPTLKASAYVIALEIGTALMQSRWRPTADLLETALELHRKTSQYGTSDFFTAVVAEALLRVGRGEEAAGFIDEYLNVHRRERSTPSRSLRLILRRASR